MTDRIYGFTGDNFFLSNFFIEHDQMTNEHRFQAAKTLDLQEMTYVLEAPTPSKAKYRGRRVTLRPDWEQVKDEAMYNMLLFKFGRSPELTEKLLATGDAELVEANTWGDKYWGVDQATGEGQNVLGKQLMRLREHLRSVHGDTEAAR